MRLISVVLIALVVALIGLIVATSCPPGAVAMHVRGMNMDRAEPAPMATEFPQDAGHGPSLRQAYVAAR